MPPSEAAIKSDPELDTRQVAAVLKSLCACFHRAVSPGLRAELFAAGCLGLVQAARKFDPAIGVQFQTFAEKRIRGAILDYLRAADPLTRLQRKAVRIGKAEPISHCRLDGVAHRLRDDAPNPEDAAIASERQRILRRIIGSLPPRERNVINDQLAGKTTKITAAELGYSPSRISQLHTKALRMIRMAGSGK